MNLVKDMFWGISNAMYSPEKNDEKAPRFGNEGRVVAVSSSPTHSFSKENLPKIHLLAGLGVEGDAHCGTTVQHRYDKSKDPERPNLRQVHLIHSELHDELRATQGYGISPGGMGENITTRGIDLLTLPAGTRLHMGVVAVVELTGLRNPCYYLNKFKPGLKQACMVEDGEGNVIRKAGVMSIVITGGDILPGDTIFVEYPPEPHRPLQVL